MDYHRKLGGMGLSVEKIDEAVFSQVLDNQKTVMGARTLFETVNAKWQRLWLVNMGYDIKKVTRTGKYIFSNAGRTSSKRVRLIEAMDYMDNLAHRLRLPIEVLQRAKIISVAMLKKDFDFRFNHASMNDWSCVILLVSAQSWNSQTFRTMRDVERLNEELHYQLIPKMITKMTVWSDSNIRRMDLSNAIEKNKGEAKCG